MKKPTQSKKSVTVKAYVKKVKTKAGPKPVWVKGVVRRTGGK